MEKHILETMEEVRVFLTDNRAEFDMVEILDIVKHEVPDLEEPAALAVAGSILESLYE